METAKTDGAANAAIFYHPDGYVTTRGKLMGRHAAGEGFLLGFAHHAQVDRFFVLAADRDHIAQFRKQIDPHRRGREVVGISSTSPEGLASAGALYVPGPGTSEYAWTRRFVGPTQWSITGVTHTICSDRVMDSIGDLLIAPFEEWDALICTSEAVRKGVENLHRAYGEYLAERLVGQNVAPRLQLPVIPLGVDCDKLGADDPGGRLRREFRRRNGIRDDEIVVLFLGRLSFHAKAHPMPMYQALQAAARSTGSKFVLAQVGWFANDAIKRAFVQGARALCPDVKNIFLDGRDPDVRAHAWKGADVFCSLSDNVQETFGLTPVEAMAAGLPVVASDWNGYRGTVEHGVTGFLVPTAMPSAGAGEELAYRYFTGRDTYDQYIGHVSQCISVDAGATADAFMALATNAELRRTMGEKGRDRARQYFDWSCVIASYQQLWSDLAARRRKAAATGVAAIKASGSPLRGDPFAVFAHYPTHVLGEESGIRLARSDAGQTWRRLAGLGLNSFSRGTFADDAEIDQLLRTISAGGADGVPLRSLLGAAPGMARKRKERTVGWLFKMGVLRLV